MILQLTATDLDLGDNARFDYIIDDVTAYCADAAARDVTATESFHVDPRSGALSVSLSLDREKHSYFRVTVYAVDRGRPASQTGSTIVEVVVDDVNDEKPTFVSARNETGSSNGGLEMSVAEDAEIGRVLGHLRAVDGDATPDNNRIHYSLAASRSPRQSAQFEVDVNTGEVRLSGGGLDRERVSSYRLTAVATDSGRPALSAVEQLVIRVTDVNDNDPTFQFPTGSTIDRPEVLW